MIVFLLNLEDTFTKKRVLITKERALFPFVRHFSYDHLVSIKENIMNSWMRFIATLFICPFLVSCFSEDMEQLLDERDALVVNSREVYKTTCVGHTEGAYWGKTYYEKKKATLEYCYYPDYYFSNGDLWAPAEMTACEQDSSVMAMVSMEFKESQKEMVQVEFGEDEMLRGSLNLTESTISLAFDNEEGQALEMDFVNRSTSADENLVESTWRLVNISGENNKQRFHLHQCDSQLVGEREVQLPWTDQLIGVVQKDESETTFDLYYIEQAGKRYLLDYVAEVSPSVEKNLPLMLGQKVIVRGHIYGAYLPEEIGFLVKEVVLLAPMDQDRFDPRRAGSSFWMVDGEMASGGQLIGAVLSEDKSVCFMNTAWKASQFVSELMFFEKVSFDQEQIQITTKNPVMPTNYSVKSYEACAQ